MKLLCTVRNGIVVLPRKKHVPDGTRVSVEIIRTKSPASGRRRTSKTDLSELLLDLVKISKDVKGLPSDLADNHDYYLHGLPKRKP